MKMKSLSSVGLGLSVIFGCLFFALIAELYYLLWWKKRIAHRDIENNYNSPARELLYMFCWKRPSSLRSAALNPSIRMTDSVLVHAEGENGSQAGKDFVFKPFGEDEMEAEFMRQHSLCGPPRFLFTIIEETKEDLESEDGKSRGENSGKGTSESRSLSDLLCAVETPYLTPMASPSFFTPPLTPNRTYNKNGFNPLFEAATDAEFNRIKSSPPPKFKFLQDAEEKLRRKLSEEAEKTLHNPNRHVQDNAEKQGHQFQVPQR